MRRMCLRLGGIYLLVGVPKKPTQNNEQIVGEGFVDNVTIFCVANWRRSVGDRIAREDFSE